MSHRYRSSPKLFVANISSRVIHFPFLSFLYNNPILQVTRSDLEDKFDRYGKVINVQLRDGRDRERFAFVEFDDVRDAEYAYDKYSFFWISFFSPRSLSNHFFSPSNHWISLPFLFVSPFPMTISLGPDLGIFPSGI